MPWHFAHDFSHVSFASAAEADIVATVKAATLIRSFRFMYF
jgi:hypothetical protein